MDKNRFEIGNLLEVQSHNDTFIYMRVGNIKYNFLDDSYVYLDDDGSYVPVNQVIRVVEKQRPKGLE